jgi:hypothetical protein
MTILRIFERGDLYRGLVAEQLRDYRHIAYPAQAETASALAWSSVALRDADVPSHTKQRSRMRHCSRSPVCATKLADAPSGNCEPG